MKGTNIKKFDLEEYLPLKILRIPLINKSEFTYNAINKKNILVGSFNDYIQQHKANEDIGKAGEFFVYKYEAESVKKYNLPESKKVKWISKDKGDGLGYDILSYDRQGNEIYIEVKTTPGKDKSSFYITANELLKSEEEKDKYFLYRVYNFDMDKKQGEISVRRGSLKDLCISPQLYKVEFQ